MGRKEGSFGTEFGCAAPLEPDVDIFGLESWAVALSIEVCKTLPFVEMTFNWLTSGSPFEGFSWDCVRLGNLKVSLLGSCCEFVCYSWTVILKVHPRIPKY